MLEKNLLLMQLEETDETPSQDLCQFLGHVYSRNQVALGLHCFHLQTPFETIAWLRPFNTFAIQAAETSLDTRIRIL